MKKNLGDPDLGTEGFHSFRIGHEAVKTEEVIMKAKTTALVFALILAGSLISVRASNKSKLLTAGGTEQLAAVLDWGTNYPPTSFPTKIRGVKQVYNETLVGPAANLLAPTVSVTLNCDLDENGYGPCWGTFEWKMANGKGTWKGLWEGSFNFLSGGYGSYTAVGHADGDKDGKKCEATVVYPGMGAPASTFVTITNRNDR
jgi:hypothetical protein